MRGTIIIKDGRDIKEVENVKGYIEMTIKKPFDKLSCLLVGDSMNTVIFRVKTKEKRFDLIKEKLMELNPEGYVFIQAKGSV